jgi:hypothetical protein
MIDLIGDIHGHADKLEALLNKMGYTIKDGIYSHPSRTVVFVGDYIDRGPKIRKTLQIVKAMVDCGNAIALMGNHEYNALCFHYPEKEGGHLRKHLIKNIIQHYETLKQFQNMQDEYEMYLDWFKTLPLFYETKEFRAVHACWDHDYINYLKSLLQDGRLNEHFMYQSVKKNTELYTAVDITLKGKELKMTPDFHFYDKDGGKQTKLRTKWWKDSKKTTIKSISVEPLEDLSETPIDLSLLPNTNYYKEDEKPVFFGHYWLSDEPMLYRNNVCCLDYSVAKDGYLVGYRFDGEEKLSNDKLVYV